MVIPSDSIKAAVTITNDITTTIMLSLAVKKWMILK
jgi:hypothetical protein